MGGLPDPNRLSDVLSELIALRGLARSGSDGQLQAVWNEIAGPGIASQTRPQTVKRGILHVAVSNAALLNELVSFHKRSLLAALKERQPQLKIRELKFRLKSDMRKT